MSAVTVSGTWLVGRLALRERTQTARLRSAYEELDRQRARAETAAAEAERTRIARELHDVVAHSLSVIAVQADAADALLERRPEPAQRAIESVRRTAHDALEEMRRLLGSLREGGDDDASPAPSLAVLPALVAGVRAAGVDVALWVEGTAVAVPAAVDAAAYRIIQEGLTNARRHAEGARVQVRIRYSAGFVEVLVANDRDGRADGRPGSRYGLVGVRERVEALAGELSAGPNSDGGWTLRVQLPLQRTTT